MRTVNITELQNSEASLPKLPKGSVDATATANERVRSSTRRVQQSATLGGYWLYAGGRPIFVRTVGRNVRADKPVQRTSRVTANSSGANREKVGIIARRKSTNTARVADKKAPKIIA